MTTTVSYNNHSLVGKALNLLADGLGPYVAGKMADAVAAGRFHPADTDALGEIAGDVAVTLRVMTMAWNDVFRDCLGPVERSLVSEIREIRNRWAHQETFDDDDLDRALDSVGRLLAAVGATEEADRVTRAKHRLRIQRYGVPTPKAAAPEPADTPPTPETASTPEPEPQHQQRPAAADLDATPAADHIEDHISRGVTYRRAEKFEQAMAEFEQAISVDPDNADAWYHHGLTWGLTGEHGRAVADFTRSIERAPEYADAYNCRGYALLCLGEYRLALRDLEEASRLNPEDELTQRNLRQARLRCMELSDNEVPV